MRHLQYRDDRLVYVDRERRDAQANRSPRSLRHEDGGTLCHSKLRKSRRNGRSRKRSWSSKPARCSPLAKSRKRTLSSTLKVRNFVPRRGKEETGVPSSFTDPWPNS